MTVYTVVQNYGMLDGGVREKGRIKRTMIEETSRRWDVEGGGGKEEGMLKRGRRGGKEVGGGDVGDENCSFSFSSSMAPSLMSEAFEG